MSARISAEFGGEVLLFQDGIIGDILLSGVNNEGTKEKVVEKYEKLLQYLVNVYPANLASLC